MSLVDIEYQGHAQRAVQRALGSDRLPHAYVFHGPDGVGKEKFASGLAELLLCGQPAEQELTEEQGERMGTARVRVGCGQCDDCRMTAADTHPDLHVVYRQLNRDHPRPEVRRRKALDLGVDVLRHFVIEKVGLTPVHGRAKVFVIREADRITPQAQNALLKTLEEPPGTTFLILLVTALDRLLPTTQSRCQVVRFDTLPTPFVRTKLAEALPQLPAEQQEWYARSSDGSAGRAVVGAEDGLFELNTCVLEGLSKLSAAGVAADRGGEKARRKTRAAPSSSVPRNDELVSTWTEQSKTLGERYRQRDPDITDTEANRRGLKAVFQLGATWYADLLRAGNGDAAFLVNTAWGDPLREASYTMGPRLAIEAVNRIARAERQLDLNVNTQLTIETLINDLARLGRGEAVPAA